MLQLKNDTPFEATIYLMPDRDGIDSLHTLLKGTFNLEESPRPADEQVPIVVSDEHYGDPQVSSVKTPGDSTVNAKTEATTTNAISMIAVSSPVIPRSDISRSTVLNIWPGLPNQNRVQVQLKVANSYPEPDLVANYQLVSRPATVWQTATNATYL